jgi:nitrogenase delta subunit
MEEKIELLVDYIMKNCLWQFNSRAWDRKNQNEGIISKATQLLCDELVDVSTPAERCYWVEAQVLADEYKRVYPWITKMEKAEIKLLMQGFKERIDYLTITASKNTEINDALY